jgi:RNA polymerase sigma factor (sigma-70 family)
MRYNYGNSTYEDFELEDSKEKMIEGIEDITNRAYLALLDQKCRRLRNFRGTNEYSFGAYLREVSFHISIDYIREQTNYIEVKQIRDKTSYNPYEKLDKQELFHLTQKIKKDLPEKHLFFFHLLYEEEFEIPEIAEIMDLNLNTIHQLKSRTINNFIRIAKQRDLFDELKQFAYS